MPLILTGTSSTTTLDSSAGLTFSDSSNQSAAASPYGLKNRIINGDMVIDQRNAGASVTITTANEYTIDRWRGFGAQSSKYSVQQNAGSVTPPTGFTNYLGATSTSAYSVLTGDYFFLSQTIEGYNFSDFSYGTANAQTATLSFWVRSSLTGTFGGSLYRGGGVNKSYLFSYTISAANTWEQKSITIAGDITSGLVSTTNGEGVQLRIGLGSGSTFSGGTVNTWQAGNFVQPTGSVSVVGTNGATFYITGVQLERNTTATPFEWLPYGMEFDLCRRYCEVYSNPQLGYEVDGIPQGIASVDLGGRGETQIFYYPKRTSPTLTVSNNNLYWQNMANTSSSCTFAGTYIGTGTNSALLFVNVSGACVAGALSGVGLVSFTNVANKMIISAEL
jgi:hypothetical protein